MVKVWTDDARGISSDIAVVTPGANIGSDTNRLGTVYADVVDATSVLGDPTLPNDTYLNALTSAAATQGLIKLDATDNTFFNVKTGKVGKFGVNSVAVGTYDSNSIDFPAFNLSDGSDKNFSLAVYAAGTAYTLTASSAPVTFGTTSPSLTLTKAGTYLILARANLQLVGATFAASRVADVHIRRTNNTPGVLANTSTDIATGITTTFTGTLAIQNVPHTLYTTANTTDILKIYADVSVIPTAGSLQITEASIVAIRLY